MLTYVLILKLNLRTNKMLGLCLDILYCFSSRPNPQKDKNMKVAARHAWCLRLFRVRNVNQISIFNLRSVDRFASKGHIRSVLVMNSSELGRV